MISTYSELKTAIQAWRNNSQIASVVSDLVSLSEAKINRKLRTRWQETALAATTPDANYRITIPTGLVAVKHLWKASDPKWRMEQKPLDYVIANQVPGSLPSLYAWSEGYWVFNGGGGDVAGVYYAKVPTLSDTATTNWLLTSHPDIYLWAGLEQACIYLRDAEGALAYQAMWAGVADELNSISVADQISGGKLIARSR